MQIGDTVTYKDISLGVIANQFGRYNMEVVGLSGPYVLVRYSSGNTGKEWPTNLRLVSAAVRKAA